MQTVKLPSHYGQWYFATIHNDSEILLPTPSFIPAKTQQKHQ